ncbi:S-adenosyl-L-methionine-dependent methyltransferase [Pilobolus umbonatus]|nr:S-adenosyl-L-methionine-dependent methyltransferase [Pilobolus umbonatus]
MFFDEFIHFLKKEFHKLKHRKKKSVMSDTEEPVTNVTSEGKNFQYIDGRRYNNDEGIEYFFPNDNDEADRLHQQHWIMRYAFQCNYHAPIKDQLEKGIAVLDAGCGPATWTFEMAESFPNSKFTGVDVSFVFPEAIRPPNVDFEICSIAKDLPFPDNSFDFYFQRFLILGLTASDWEAALKNAFRVLKPGAYIEVTEPTLKQYYHAGPKTAAIQDIMSAVMLKKGLVPEAGPQLERMLTEAGFINVTVNIRPLPINHTNKIGETFWQDCSHAYANLRPMLALDTPEFEDPEVYKEYVKTLGDECTEMKTNMIFYVTNAQKPFEEV